IELFRQLGVPILGIIENMAWLETESGKRQYLFGEGGAERAADQHRAPFLGALPIFPELREASDAGEPLTWTEPQSRAAKAFDALAEKIAARFV
ncbi:MAG: P-loop NTPase, partial [Parvularculaceae bacterium]